MGISIKKNKNGDYICPTNSISIMSHSHETDPTTQKAKDIIVVTFMALAAFFITACVILYSKTYTSPHPEGSEQSIVNDK